MAIAGIAAQAAVHFLRASRQLRGRFVRDPVCRDFRWRRSVDLAASVAPEQSVQVQRTLAGGIR